VNLAPGVMVKNAIGALGQGRVGVSVATTCNNRCNRKHPAEYQTCNVCRNHFDVAPDLTQMSPHVEPRRNGKPTAYRRNPVIAPVAAGRRTNPASG